MEPSLSLACNKDAADADADASVVVVVPPQASERIGAPLMPYRLDKLSGEPLRARRAVCGADKRVQS